MSSQSTSKGISHEVGEMTTQAQLKRDEIMNQKSHVPATNPQSSDDQNSTYTSQATNFIQQTGEQVKNMAQGAADVVKNTLGMNNASNAPNADASANPNRKPGTKHPSNPSSTI
ncbi:hypothetical protein REPUB_Repub13aG0162500 [Reevesia pubescens]